MLDKKQPIIVKKIDEGHHAAHGGAWKVAFADFATAMMAFFMLMWLLGSTSEAEREGIAEYFINPTAMMGPGGASTSMIDLGGTMDYTPGDSAQYQRGDDKSTNKLAGETDAESEQMKERRHLDDLMEEIKKAVAASPELKQLQEQLLLDITVEGLRIQIIDKDDRPMFDKGTADLKYYAAQLLFELAHFIEDVPNNITITGHTSARKPKSEEYSNWELSTDRANTARRALVDGGMSANKVSRIIGLASSILFDKKDPLSAVNRRISIVVMNKAVEDEYRQREEVAEYVPSEETNVDMDDRGFNLSEIEGEPMSESSSGNAGHGSTPGASNEAAMPQQGQINLPSFPPASPSNVVGNRPTGAPPVSVAPSEGKISFPGIGGENLRPINGGIGAVNEPPVSRQPSVSRSAVSEPASNGSPQPTAPKQEDLGIEFF